MLKLYERLPDSVTVGGRNYRLDLDFRNVMKMMDIITNADLLPDSRDWHGLRCVLRGRMPRRYREVFNAVFRLLFGTDNHKGGEKITSFVQDADLIRAAFWQEYGINLYRDKLHWFEFMTLIGNLPSGSKYTDVLTIRTRDIPAPSKYNTKEREELMKMKAQFALDISEEERKKKYQEFTHNAFLSLSRMAKG